MKEKMNPGEATAHPPMIGIQELLDAISACNPKANTDFVREAYTYAESAYSGQRLRNGVPYISFPLAVADTLAHLRLDESAIAAALLYDTMVDQLRHRPEPFRQT